MFPRKYVRLSALVAATSLTVIAILWMFPRPSDPLPLLPEVGDHRSVSSPAELEAIYQEACQVVGRHYFDLRRLQDSNFSQWHDRYHGKLKNEQEMAEAVYTMLKANVEQPAVFLERAQFAYWSATGLRGLKLATGITVGGDLSLAKVQEPLFKGWSDRPSVGNRIIFVDGRSVASFSAERVQKMLELGPPGSLVQIVVVRKTDSPRKTMGGKKELPWRTFTLTRYLAEEEEKAAIRTHFQKKTPATDKGPGLPCTAVLEPRHLNNPDTVRMFAAHLEEYKIDGVEGLLIDLTGDGGGDAQTVAKLAALFLKGDGPVLTVVEEDSPQPVTIRYYMQGGKLWQSRQRGGTSKSAVALIVNTPVNLFDKPVVVAINEQTKGGCKLLAEALRGRATICGTASGGGPYFAVGYPVGRQHYLSLLAAHCLTSDGRVLDVVEPDDRVGKAGSSFSSMSSALQRAQELLNEKASKQDSGKHRP